MQHYVYKRLRLYRKIIQGLGCCLSFAVDVLLIVAVVVVLTGVVFVFVTVVIVLVALVLVDILFGVIVS